MAMGRPRKRAKKNINGLRNQNRPRTPLSDESPDEECDIIVSDTMKQRRDTLDTESVDSTSDGLESWSPCLAADGDSMKIVGYDAVVVSDDVEASEVECDNKWEDELEHEILFSPPSHIRVDPHA